MIQNSAKKRPLNTNIPENLFLDVERYCKDTGYSKTQIVIAALTQFLAIKGEEMDFKATYPDRRVKSRIVVEAMPREDEEQRMASVLLY